MESYIIKLMSEENKRLFGFILEERRLKALENSKNTPLGCYGKLMRN